METKDKTTKELLEKTVMDTCIKAGRFLNENAFMIDDLQWKRKDDPVTNLDKTSEQMIRQDILEKFNANITGEEYGIDDRKADINIYIDPIDGTKSFCRGEFCSSVSIAAEMDGKLMFGVVYDFMKDIVYYANEKGAFMNRSSWDKPKALPAVNFLLTRPTISFDNAGIYLDALKGDINTRQPIGSIALSLAQLASGSYEGILIKSKKHGATDTCDIAAGYYILKQAGIKMTDFDFNEFDYKNPTKGLIALNQRCDYMWNIVKEAKVLSS